MSDNKSPLSSFDKRPPLSSFDKRAKKTNESTLGQKVVGGISDAAPILGGILGGLAGTAVGAPTGPGALVTGAAGTAAGTGAGMAFGESLENLTGYQDETQQELAREAVVEPVVSGAVDLATAGTAKVLAPVAKAGSGLVKGAYRVFVPKNASAKTFASIFKTSRKIASQLQPEKTAKELVKHGISGDLDDLATVASRVTGSDGVISKLTRNIIGKIDEGVELGAPLKAANEAADNATALEQDVLKKIKIHVNKIITKNQGKTPLAINALDALDAERELESIGYNLLNKARTSLDGVGSEVLEQKASVYLSAAEELRSSIDRLGIKGTIIDNFKTPNILAELRSISPRLESQFKNAKSISEIRSIAKPFVRLGKLIEATKEYEGSAFIKGLEGRPSLIPFVGEALGRPEAKTAFSQAQQGLSESVVGQAQRGIEKAASVGNRAMSEVAEPLTRILAQIGLVPR